MSEREPQSLTAQPQADGARRECGSAAPSRSESADHPEPERAAMMARVREITRDLKVVRDPWIVRDLVRERRDLHRALGWTP